MMLVVLKKEITQAYFKRAARKQEKAIPDLMEARETAFLIMV